MEITQQQYEKISGIFPRQRGNVTIDNLTMLNAMLHVLEHGCKWRGLPSSFGNWHSIYTRMSRWSKNGVLDRIFARLQQEQMSASMRMPFLSTARSVKFILTEPGH